MKFAIEETPVSLKDGKNGLFLTKATSKAKERNVKRLQYTETIHNDYTLICQHNVHENRT